MTTIAFVQSIENQNIWTKIRKRNINLYLFGIFWSSQQLETTRMQAQLVLLLNITDIPMFYKCIVFHIFEFLVLKKIQVQLATWEIFQYFPNIFLSVFFLSPTILLFVELGNKIWWLSDWFWGPVRESTKLSIVHCTSELLIKNTQIHKYTNTLITQIHWYQYTNTQIHKYKNTQIPIQKYQYTNKIYWFWGSGEETDKVVNCSGSITRQNFQEFPNNFHIIRCNH